MSDSYKKLIDDLVEEENYEALLKELLAVCHRDGGHYTVLAGYSVSLLDAIIFVQDLIRENRELKDHVRRNKKKSP
jgi:hypothetical protein